MDGQTVRAFFFYFLVYDILGRKTETFVNEELLPESYTIIFESEMLTNGIYFYTLLVGGDKY